MPTVKHRLQSRLALKRFVNGFATQSAAAQWLGLSTSHLSHILAGRKRVTDKTLDKIGFRLEVVSK